MPVDFPACELRTRSHAQKTKAQNFTSQELYVLFNELASRFAEYFSSKAGMPGLSSVGSTRQKTNLQICEEIAYKITTTCGVPRQDKQVLERIRLEINRIRGKLDSESNGIIPSQPVPPYMLEIEAMYRRMLMLKGGDLNNRVRMTEDDFADIRAQNWPRDDVGAIGIYNLKQNFHSSQPSPLGTPTTSFEPPRKRVPYIGMEPPMLGVQNESGGINAKIKVEPSSSFIPSYSCRTCTRQYPSDRLRVCASCATDAGVSTDDFVFDELLKFVYCNNCAMDEHVDRDHKTERLLKYDSDTKQAIELRSNLDALNGALEECIREAIHTHSNLALLQRASRDLSYITPRAQLEPVIESLKLMIETLKARCTADKELVRQIHSVCARVNEVMLSSNDDSGMNEHTSSSDEYRHEEPTSSADILKSIEANCFYAAKIKQEPT